MFDMAVHNPPSRDALLQLNEKEVFDDLNERIKFTRPHSPHNMWVHNGYLVAGYDAWYYSYIWYIFLIPRDP
jgi:Zn-dependent oligopeptidase